VTPEFYFLGAGLSQVFIFNFLGEGTSIGKEGRPRICARPPPVPPLPERIRCFALFLEDGRAGRSSCCQHLPLQQWLGQPDLNVGAIVSLAPNLKPFTDLLGVDVETVKKVLASWGPGRFDAEPDKDGKAFVQTASRRERSSRYRLSTTGDDRLCTSTRCP